MASRFWVGSGSSTSWAATGNTNWAATSGGANNASVPTTTDVAIFDSNSGVANSVIAASVAIQGLECDGSTAGTGTYAGTLTHNTSVTLTINSGLPNSLRLTSGMTYTPASTTSLVTFTNTTGTAQLKSAGKVFTAITVNGAGGTVQQQDALSINGVQSSILTLTNGIFDGNSNALTVCRFSSSNSNTRSMLLGSALTLGGNIANGAVVWDTGTATGLTFTKNSCNITILAPNSSIQGFNFTSSLTFNDITLNAASNTTAIFFSAANTFAHLNVGSGWSLYLASGVTQTISNAFTLTGTKANPINLISTSNGAVTTISCPSGACTLTWGSLFGVTGSGGATFTATNTLNGGTNSGWSITPPADASLTPAGIATAVWQDTTSGDFTVAGSIGKSLFTSGATPGAASGLALVGSAMNTTQIAGSATAATNLSGNTLDTTTGVVGVGSTTISVVTSSMTPPGSVANQFGSNVNPRMLIFDVATTTAALRNQATVVSASTNAAAPVLTVNALTTAPATTDTFRIL